jgi:hypothetical protein
MLQPSTEDTSKTVAGVAPECATGDRVTDHFHLNKKTE